MDITHPGQQLIFNFDVFVELFLYTFYCLFHTLELLLFHVIIYVIYLCLTNIILVLIIFVVSFYVCAYIYMYTYLCVTNPLIYLYFFMCFLFFVSIYFFNDFKVDFIIFSGLCSLHMYMYVGINICFMSHPFVYMCCTYEI